MTLRQIAQHISDFTPDHRAQLTAKQLMDISKGFNYFMAEQIQIAPCDHTGEVYYETMSGKFCGICQRLMEKETVNGMAI